MLLSVELPVAMGETFDASPPFRRGKRMPGRIDPERRLVPVSEAAKKHPCPDCQSCQWCSDSRCRMCLRRGSGACRKLSLREQIELFERMNGRKEAKEQPAGCPGQRGEDDMSDR